MLPIEYIAIALVVVVLIFIYSSIVAVKQGQQYTIERFGRYTRTLMPGLHILMPFVERIGAKVNMMENVLDVPSQEAITRDNARVRVDAVVFFQVLDASKSAYEISDLNRAILNLSMTNIRTVIGSLDLDEALSQRDRINNKLLSVVDEATAPWGIKITRVEIKDISPPHDLVEAMARQMKAEREKRASILEAEGARQAEILRAEGDKLGTILEADGRKEAAFRDAEARERLAEAEAKATMMVSEAISKGNVNALNYFVAQKYVEAITKIGSASNSKMVFMPLEASSLVGAIGGIAELTKEALGTKEDRK